MLNKLAKILLVSTSLAPILLTYWFTRQVNSYHESFNLMENLKLNWHNGILLLIITILLTLLCSIIISQAKKHLEIIPVEIREIKTCDNESLGFILVYLLPLAGEVTDSINLPVLIFIGVLFFFVVATSNAYHFNPLLSILGYHFYEVMLKSGVTYILISKRDLRNSKRIEKIGLLTEYMIIEKNEL